MTKLVLHYAPGVLAVLKREPCPGQEMFGGKIGHNTCGCDRGRDIFRIVNVSVLTDGERPLQLCWIPKP